MINFLKSFFSYVPASPPPEVPEEEPPDPNSGKLLSDEFRKARRNLVIIAAVCIAWSGAQFTIADPSIEVATVSLRFDDASIPMALGFLLAYLAYRWVFEYAIMERPIRRWYPAQFDFRLVAGITRFALIAVCAGALQRSVWTIVLLLGMLGALAFCVVISTLVLIFVTMPTRLWASKRVGRISVANAAFEAYAWATFFSILLSVIGVIGLGVASYRYPPLSSFLWVTPPNIVSYSVFIIVVVAVFLSHWLLLPHLSKLFAERPCYRTYREKDGTVVYRFGVGLETSYDQTAEKHDSGPPATRSELDSEASDEPQPESEGRSR